MTRRLRILTWHTHGSYLLYLAQAPHDFYVLSKPGRPAGYAGRSGHLPWGDNVHDLPADEARRQAFDCIVFQDDAQYLEDQYELLTPAQRRLPRIYIEHDTPRPHPVETRHPVDDPDVLLVHVTAFNRLMWDNGRTPTKVIDHGVIDPGYLYTGTLGKGIVVVNDLATRGRRLGHDLFEALRRRVPLDLVGLRSEAAGGLGEVLHRDLPSFNARYRFLFNPIRWTSMGLGVIEAMMTGLPVVAVASTEMVTVIRDGENGFIDTDTDRLAERMAILLKDRALAARLGRAARQSALRRFGIERFVADWNAAFAEVTGLAEAKAKKGSEQFTENSA
ncbi:MAG TPA: glycosyltransferase [Burkholderiales bacterium]|nr:glycosyltransferase [Burkholderiales bacterium]